MKEIIKVIANTEWLIISSQYLVHVGDKYCIRYVFHFLSQSNCYETVSVLYL